MCTQLHARHRDATRLAPTPQPIAPLACVAVESMSCAPALTAPPTWLLAASLDGQGSKVGMFCVRQHDGGLPRSHNPRVCAKREWAARGSGATCQEKAAPPRPQPCALTCGIPPGPPSAPAEHPRRPRRRPGLGPPPPAASRPGPRSGPAGTAGAAGATVVRPGGTGGQCVPRFGMRPGPGWWGGSCWLILQPRLALSVATWAAEDPAPCPFSTMLPTAEPGPGRTQQAEHSRHSMLSRHSTGTHLLQVAPQCQLLRRLVCRQPLQLQGRVQP